MSRWLAFAALTLWIAAGPAGAEPQVLIDTDFGAADVPVHDVSADGLKSITGVLPQGWRDNTGWKNEVRIEYAAMDQGAREFLRITQTKGGGVQLAHDLPGIEKEDGLYRLTFTARSPAGTGGSLGIRFIGPPYTTCWQGSPNITKDWQEFSFDIRLAKQPQAVGLFLWPNEGVLDLQRLRLTTLSPAELIAEAKARYPAPAGKNRVQQSRFPLGLQSGWFLDRDNSDGDEVIVGSGPIAGPSRLPALGFRGAQPWKVTTAPFLVPPWSDQPHVLSVWLRGSATGKLVVFADGRTLAEERFTADPVEWRRGVVKFKPALFAKATALRIEATGDLWIDGLQVEEGSEPTPFAPPARSEVALALPPSDASAARVQFADEKATLLFAAMDVPSRSTLRAKVVNVYGDEKLLPPVLLQKGALVKGSLRYDVFPARPYGACRIEAWVADPEGQPASPVSELVVYRLRRPRYWGKDAPDSPFGVHTNSTMRHDLMAKAIGCNWVRLHDAGTQYIGWSFLEPEKGRWHFYDAPIQRYRKCHLKILGLVSTAPGWATDWGQPANGYFERYFEPKNMEDWANYVRTVVTRYKGVIDSYEVWNEPWGSSFWIGSYDRENTSKPFMERLIRSKTAAEDYARLQKTAYEAAKAADPKVRILGFNTTPGDWTASVLAAGGMNTCDAVSYHNYVSGLVGAPNDDPTAGYHAALDPISKKLGSLPKPIWMSEGNTLGSLLENGFYHYTVPYDAPSGVMLASDRLARYVLSHRVLGEAKTFLYTMHGHGAFGVRHEWTALVAGDGYLHPSGAAYSALAWLLEDTRYVSTLQPAEGVYAFLFAGKGRAVAAVSSRPTHAAYALPAAPGVSALDLFGNPLPAGSPLGTELAYLTAKDTATLEKALGAEH